MQTLFYGHLDLTVIGHYEAPSPISPLNGGYTIFVFRLHLRIRSRPLGVISAAGTFSFQYFSLSRPYAYVEKAWSVQPAQHQTWSN
jgi:hypothetical protein